MSLIEDLLLDEKGRRNSCGACLFERWLKDTDPDVWAEYAEARAHPDVPHTGLWRWVKAQYPDRMIVQSGRFGVHRNTHPLP